MVFSIVKGCATYTFSDVFEDYINVVPPISGMTLSDLNYDTDVKEHKRFNAGEQHT